MFSRCTWYWDVTLQETVDSQILYSYGEKIPQARTASKDYLLFLSRFQRISNTKWPNGEVWFGGAKSLLILKRAWDSCLSLQPASLPPKNQSSNKNPSWDLPYKIDNGQYSWIGLRLNFKRKRPYTFHGNNMSIPPGTGIASGDHSRVPGDHSAACGVQVEAPMFFVAGMSPPKNVENMVIKSLKIGRYNCFQCLLVVQTWCFSLFSSTQRVGLLSFGGIILFHIVSWLSFQPPTKMIIIIGVEMVIAGRWYQICCTFNPRNWMIIPICPSWRTYHSMVGVKPPWFNQIVTVIGMYVTTTGCYHCAQWDVRMFNRLHNRLFLGLTGFNDLPPWLPWYHAKTLALILIFSQGIETTEYGDLSQCVWQRKWLSVWIGPKLIVIDI
jgi:hypothetical protein